MKRKKQDEFNRCQEGARNKGAAQAEQEALNDANSSDAAESDESDGEEQHDTEQVVRAEAVGDDFVIRLLLDSKALRIPKMAKDWCFVHAHVPSLVKFDVDGFAFNGLDDTIDNLPSDFFLSENCKQTKGKHFLGRDNFPAELQECASDLMEGVNFVLSKLLVKNLTCRPFFSFGNTIRYVCLRDQMCL